MTMNRPLVIDLFCGSFGWSRGFVEEGWRSIGFDISHEEHHGPPPEHCQLVLQDCLTLHGSQFKDADCIVASPPCVDYSYLAMPWSRSTDIVRPCGDGWEVLNSAAAKEMRAEWEHEGPDNRLFDACFRIQREAIAAAGHFIPLIVENVRGAQPWVGRSAWNFGSYHLWGNVPALMPITLKRGMKKNPEGTDHPPGSWFAIADSKNRGAQSDGQKTQGGSWFRERNGQPQPGIRHEDRGIKIAGDWFSDPNSTCRRHGSKSKARKAASAQIAMIPPDLSRHIARVYKPRLIP